MNATDYTERKFLGIFKGNGFSAPLKTYAGLFLSDPQEGTTGGIEVSYEGYQRAEIVEWTQPEWLPAENKMRISNITEAVYPKSPTPAGTITHLVIFDSQEGGNRLFYAPLEEAITLEADEAPTLVKNEINFYSKGDLTQEYKSKLLNILNGVSISAVTPHIALFNGENELTAENYARVPITFGDVVESSNGTAIISNIDNISFNRASTSWGVFDRFAIYNSLSGGSKVWEKLRSTPKNITRLRIERFLAGDLEIGVN